MFMTSILWLFLSAYYSIWCKLGSGSWDPSYAFWRESSGISSAWRRRGQLETARTTLIQLLIARFGELPEKSMAVIQATTDLKQLNTWLVRFATADTLEAVGIGA